jgi:hypothetical protein
VRADRKGRVGLSRTLFALVPVTLLALAVAVPAEAATPARHRPPASGRPAKLPNGWKSSSYQQVTISVPSDWAVKHDTDCANTSAPGVLLLGTPSTPMPCPLDSHHVDQVTVTDVPVGDDRQLPPAGSAERINGIRVYELFGSPSALEWVAPSRHIEISGSGPESERIVHTLRPSRSPRPS